MEIVSEAAVGGVAVTSVRRQGPPYRGSVNPDVGGRQRGEGGDAEPIKDQLSHV